MWESRPRHWHLHREYSHRVQVAPKLPWESSPNGGDSSRVLLESGGPDKASSMVTAVPKRGWARGRNTLWLRRLNQWGSAPWREKLTPVDSKGGGGTPGQRSQSLEAAEEGKLGQEGARWFARLRFRLSTPTDWFTWLGDHWFELRLHFTVSPEWINLKLSGAFSKETKAWIDRVIIRVWPGHHKH